MTKSKVAVILVAAGRGVRAGGDIAKQYRTLAGKMVLRHTLDALLSHDAINDVITVINPDDRVYYDAAISGLKLAEPVDGGDSRQQSVFNGLEALQASAPDIVLIHDAARPFVSAALLDSIFKTLDEGAIGALPALPVVDTLKYVDDETVTNTVDRSNLYRAQTPQGFAYADIYAAHVSAVGLDLTDDVAIAEKAGITIKICQGDEANIKLTLPHDFEKAEEILMGAQCDIRTGQGFDVHRFEDGDHVWLCGIKIPHSQSLKGHSDADVAMHALTDALYGSVGAGDIGVHFPPSEEKWKGAASDIFLKHAADTIKKQGGRIMNVDVTIICESPKIAPHQQVMRESLAKIMDISPTRISVKATTTEKLGFTGRGEGIAAQAIATVSLPSGNDNA